MALIPLVKINDTIKKYENKEKHHIYVETLVRKKTTGKEENFINEFERNYKVRLIENKP